MIDNLTWRKLWGLYDTISNWNFIYLTWAETSFWATSIITDTIWIFRVKTFLSELKLLFLSCCFIILSARFCFFLFIIFVWILILRNDCCLVAFACNNFVFLSEDLNVYFLPYFESRWLQNIWIVLDWSFIGLISFHYILLVLYLY